MREYAAREGAEVVAELVDLGRGRRGRAQAFALVEAGVVDRVVVYDLDRLGRKRADTDDWLTPFADYPGRLYVLHGPGGQGPVDLTSAYSRFVLGVLAAFAEAEERHQEARKEFQRRTQEEKRAPRADTREA